VDAYRDQDVRGALAPLALLAEQSETAIVVVRHLSKLPSRNPLYRGGGSIGIVGAARSGLLVAQDPADPAGQRRILATYKANLAALPPALPFRLVPSAHGVATVAWADPSPLTAADLLVPALPPEERADRDEAVTILRDLLASGPRPAQEVAAQARQAGLGPFRFRQARAALGVRAQKQGNHSTPLQRWLLCLPEHLAPGTEASAAAEDAEGAEAAEDVEGVVHE
jgi:hypothetical protein